MFINRLSPTQQAVLLSTAEQLIAADNNISAQETAFLHVLQSQMEPGIKSLPISITDFPAIFNTKSTKVGFLLELLGVAHADAEYQIAEKDFIGTIATAMSISMPLLEDMERWVCRQFALVKEAEEFMRE